MNLKYIYSVFLLSGVFIVTGCGVSYTPEQLGRACVSAVESFLPEGNEIFDLTNTEVSAEPSYGEGYQQITVTVEEGDDWYKSPQKHTCIIAKEGRGIQIMQVNAHGRIIGQDGDQIRGSMQDQITMTDRFNAGLEQ